MQVRLQADHGRSQALTEKVAARVGVLRTTALAGRLGLVTSARRRSRASAAVFTLQSIAR